MVAVPYTVLIRNNNSYSVCTRMNAHTDNDEDTQDYDEGGMYTADSPILARKDGAVMVRDTKMRRRRVVMC